MYVRLHRAASQCWSYEMVFVKAVVPSNGLLYCRVVVCGSARSFCALRVGQCCSRGWDVGK